MIKRMAKFGVVSAFVLTAGQYLLQGAGPQDVDVTPDTRSAVTVPEGMVIPGADGLDYTVGAADVAAPSEPARAPAAPVQQDPVLSNAQFYALENCVRRSEHRLDRVQGTDAFSEAFFASARLLNQDGLALESARMTTACMDFVPVFVDQIATVAEGYCRPVTLPFNHQNVTRLVDMQFCRSQGEMIVGQAGVGLRRQP